MIRRTFDPAFLTEVVNHPEVRPWLAGKGELDISDKVLTADNYVLVTEFGGFILVQHEPGRYEVHSQFLPGHGSHPIRAMLEAQEWMFARTDCEAIVSKVPHANQAAKGLAIAGGLRTIFNREESELGPCAYVELTLMDWAMRTARLEKHGERFHAASNAAAKAAGANWPEHLHDPAHERAVGAALLMVERGQAEKGVTFYNRWARLAGYPTANLPSISPPVVDMSTEQATLVMGFGPEGMEVLLCR